MHIRGRFLKTQGGTPLHSQMTATLISRPTFLQIYNLFKSLNIIQTGPSFVWTTNKKLKKNGKKFEICLLVEEEERIYSLLFPIRKKEQKKAKVASFAEKTNHHFLRRRRRIES